MHAQWQWIEMKHALQRVWLFFFFLCSIQLWRPRQCSWMYPWREWNVLEGWIQSSFTQRSPHTSRLQVHKLVIVCDNARSYLYVHVMLAPYCMATSIRNGELLAWFFLVFHRYTVVFKEHEYLENEKQHFERCLVSCINAHIQCKIQTQCTH